MKFPGVCAVVIMAYFMNWYLLINLVIPRMQNLHHAIT